MKIYQISVDYFKYMLLYTLHICLKDVEYQAFWVATGVL